MVCRCFYHVFIFLVAAGKYCPLMDTKININRYLRDIIAFPSGNLIADLRGLSEIRD
jgi:hypothetical protein